MVCKITRPEPQVLFDRIKSMFSVNVLGGAEVIPESNEHYVVANDYAMAESFYAYADQMAQNNDPETACCDDLITMAARNGVYPYPASFAEGYIKLTGTPGAVIPALPIEVTTSSSGTFRSVGSVPTELDANGTAVVRMRALVTGSLTSQPETGTLVTPIAGVDQTVIFCGSPCGGADAETCETFRTRYINRLAYKPRATFAWIMDKFLEWPCATRVLQRAGSCCECDDCAECDGCANCRNRLDFYVMFDDSFTCGIPPQHIVDDLNDWMFGARQGFGMGQVEIGVCGSVHRPIAVQLDLRIDISGCPSSSAIRAAEDGVRELFRTIAPSSEITIQQITVAIAEAVGADKDIAVLFDTDTPEDRIALGITACCGMNPQCDILPCLRIITFTSPSNDATECP